MTAEQQEMLQLINQARAQKRECGNKTFPAVPALKWNDSLARASQSHANNMAKHNYFQPSLYHHHEF